MEDTMRRPSIHQIRIPIRQVISSHLTIYQVMNTATPTTTLPLLQSKNLAQGISKCSVKVTGAWPMESVGSALPSNERIWSALGLGCSGLHCRSLLYTRIF